MQELKTLTEYQLLKLASHSLLERMAREEEVNVRTKKELGRDNHLCQDRLKMYNEQMDEIKERILEIEHNNKG